MAAHSPTSPVIPPVLPDQPPSGWDNWLREMAQAINLIGAELERVRERLEALEGP